MYIQIITVIAKKINHISPPLVLKVGKSLPVSNKTETDMLISLAKDTITAKNFSETVDNPDTKHSKSSGKNGKIRAKVKNTLSLPFIIFNPLFKFFFPINHPTVFTPNFRPIINATIEPKTIEK